MPGSPVSWGSNLFPLLLITSSGGFTGLFEYSPAPGTGTLILSSTAANGTDPYGNQFFQGLATYAPSAGVARVITLLSTANNALFEYATPSGGVQGQMILAVSSAAGVDPVAGFNYNAGVYGLDPVGGNLTVAGPVITFGEISFTRSAQIKPVVGSGATPPYLQLDAPEQTHASHLQMVMGGESPSAATAAQLLAGVVSGSGTLTSLTGSTIETQAGSATSSSLSGVQPSLPASSLGLDIRITGDTASRACLTSGFTGAGAGVTAGAGTAAHDTILIRTAVGEWVTSTLSAIEPATTTTAEIWHNVTGGVGYNAGFTDAGGGLPAAAYRLEPDGTVRFRGAFKLTANQAAGTAAFTVPAAYRQPTGFMVAAVAVALGGGVNNGASQIQFPTTGNIQIGVASVTNDIWALDGLTFPLT